MAKRRGIFSRIADAGRSVRDDFTNELISNPKFAQMIGHAIERAQKTKSAFNKNIQFVINSLNLPTRADYNDQLDRIDNMNKALTGLESRIDDLVALTERLTKLVGNTGGKK